MLAADGFANPIFCAIDRPDLPAPSALARTLSGLVGGLKLGLEFFVANGAHGRARDRRRWPADLPRPQAARHPQHGGRRRARRAAAGAGHADAARRRRPGHAGGGGGRRGRRSDAAVAARDHRAHQPGRHRSRRHRHPGAPRCDQVLRMAELCAAAGLDGVVCSPHEISGLRERFGRDLKLVVPGIRAAGDAVGDQKRTMPAAEAMARGADVLVVGRPITRSSSPRLPPGRWRATCRGPPEMNFQIKLCGIKDADDHWRSPRPTEPTMSASSSTRRARASSTSSPPPSSRARCPTRLAP